MCESRMSSTGENMIERAKLIQVFESAEVRCVYVLPQIDCETDITRINRILAAPLMVITTPVLV